MKKNHQTDNAAVIEKLDLADTLEENSIIQWIVNNIGTLLFVSGALLTALALIYRFVFADFVKSEESFINAETTYQSFLKTQEPAKKLELLSLLTTLMSRYPELHAKYDGAIAQHLISQGMLAEALPFANLAIQRTDAENAPFYSSFAKSTLLIAESRYEEALAQATELHTLLSEQLKKQDHQANLTSNSPLFAYNLLRIGMLQKQLNLKDQELKTWNAWKRLSAESNDTKSNSVIKGDAFQKINNYFQDGKINLNNYIETRENLLRKS